MHETQCVTRSESCKLGRDGHCSECPFRGSHDERWKRVSRLRMWAASVGNAPYPYPPSLVIEKDPTSAALLWPLEQRDWIDRDNCWVERARYWASMHTQELIRQLLREAYDSRQREIAERVEGADDE